MPGQAAQPLESVEEGQGGRTATNTPVVQNTAVIEVNEANITRFLDRLDKAIKENDADKFAESEFEIQAMINAQQEITSAFNIVAAMFYGSDITDTL